MKYYLLLSAVALLSTFIIIGHQVSKSVNSSSGYFLADRELGTMAISFSLLATQIGAGVILGTSNSSYRFGLYGIFYPLGLSLGLIAISLFGAKQLRQKNISTVPELFELEYKSRFLRKITSLISILSLYGILVSLIIGTKQLFSVFSLDHPLILYTFWLTLILYTVLGGLKAVIYTDVVQIIFIFLVFFVVFLYYAFYQVEYIQFSLKNLCATVEESEMSSLVPLVITPFLYVYIEQDVAQRFFSAKSPEVARKSAVIAGILLMFFSFIPVLFGVAARTIEIIPQGSNEMIYFITSTSNNFITSSVLLAVLCAVISTADSLLCAITSHISLDFVCKKKAPINLRYIRAATMTIGMIAVTTAGLLNSIIDTMIISYQIMVSTLFFPTILAHFDLKKSPSLAYISIILGSIGFFLYSNIDINHSHIPKELFCISLSSLSLPIDYLYKRYISYKSTVVFLTKK